MRRPALALALGLSTLGTGLYAAAPDSASLKDRGTFVLSLAGQPVGTETFDIRSSRDRIEAEAEIQLRIERDGKVHDFQTSSKLVMDGEHRPLSYSWSQKGAQSSRLEVDFSSTPARAHYKTVDGQDDVRDFDLPKDVLVLDDNVIHHYQLIIARYRKSGGQKQSLQAFIPQEALPGMVSVEDLGKEELDLGRGVQDLRHLVISTELARIDLWVDKEDRLQRVSIPSAQLEALRKK